MEDILSVPPSPPAETEDQPKVRSLRELIDLVIGKNLEQDYSGVIQVWPNRFLSPSWPWLASRR